MSWGAGQPALLLIYVTCIDGEIEGVTMTITADQDAVVVSSSSLVLGSYEQYAFVNGGHRENLRGKHGIAKFNPEEYRWYFRAGHTDEWFWVPFEFLSFVPGAGDRIFSSSESLDPVRRFYGAANLTAQNRADKIIEVTGVAYDSRTAEGNPAAEATVITPQAWIIGEIKSQQKPDDTEQVVVKAMAPYSPYSNRSMLWHMDDPNAQHKHFKEVFNGYAKYHLARTEANAYRDDIELVGTMLRDEAEARNWCGEYDQFVDDFNSKSQRGYIESRERDYDVTVEVTVSMTVPVMVCVSATSDEDASAIVGDSIESYVDDYQIRDAISNLDPSFTIEDTEVSDVNEA